MPDDFVAVREFDSFVISVRNDFKSLSEQLSQVGTKIDALMATRIDEARLIGEMTGSIGSIKERIDRHEAEHTGIVADIDSLRTEHEEALKNKLSLFWQLVVLISAGVATSFFLRRT